MKFGNQTYPKITAFHFIILLSIGAPLTPWGGSVWSLLKSLIKRLLAGVDMFIWGGPNKFDDVLMKSKAFFFEQASVVVTSWVQNLLFFDFSSTVVVLARKLTRKRFWTFVVHYFQSVDLKNGCTFLGSFGRNWQYGHLQYEWRIYGRPS